MTNEVLFGNNCLDGIGVWTREEVIAAMPGSERSGMIMTGSPFLRNGEPVMIIPLSACKTQLCIGNSDEPSAQHGHFS